MDHAPQSIYWKSFKAPEVIDRKEGALSDLQDMINQESKEDIAAYFAEIQTELKKKAIAADAECEDQPVPKGWPEPTD